MSCQLNYSSPEKKKIHKINIKCSICIYNFGPQHSTKGTYKFKKLYKLSPSKTNKQTIITRCVKNVLAQPQMSKQEAQRPGQKDAVKPDG